MNGNGSEQDGGYRTLAIAVVVVLALVVLAVVHARLVSILEAGVSVADRYVTTIEAESKRTRQHTLTRWEQGGRVLEVDQDRGAAESIREWHEEHAKSVATKRDVERDVDLANEEKK